VLGSDPIPRGSRQKVKNSWRSSYFVIRVQVAPWVRDERSVRGSQSFENVANV
jgi:hypothetical protein